MGMLDGARRVSSGCVWSGWGALGDCGMLIRASYVPVFVPTTGHPPVDGACGVGCGVGLITGHPPV